MYVRVFRFEKLAEECKNNIDILKKAHAKGRSVPKYHTEERTFNTVKYEHKQTHTCTSLNKCVSLLV